MNVILNNSLLKVIASKTDITAAVNLTWLIKSYETALYLIDKGVICGIREDMEKIAPTALMWFLRMDETNHRYVPWHEISNMARNWPICDQLALLKLNHVDWAFEGILELGFLNNYWNHEAILSEKIESWLWHYDEETGTDGEYEAGNESARRVFADAAISAGAGSYWSIAEEDMLKEERNLQRVTELLFGKLE